MTSPRNKKKKFEEEDDDDEEERQVNPKELNYQRKGLIASENR